MRSQGRDAVSRIEDVLPNGFHDALLRAWSVDFQTRTFTLDLAVDTSTPDPERTRLIYRHGRLTLTEVMLLKIDNMVTLLDGLSSGVPIDSGELEDQRRIEFMPTIGSGSFFRWVFLGERDCMLYVAGSGAQWEWID